MEASVGLYFCDSGPEECMKCLQRGHSRDRQVLLCPVEFPSSEEKPDRGGGYGDDTGF